MLASKPSRQSSAVWQGSTKDGYTLRLTRSMLTQISSQLKLTGLEHLVHSLRINNQVNLEGAVIRSIAQVVNHATASGTVSSREFGQNLQAFTAIGKTRKYQILTQPIDRKQSAILFVRSTPIQKLSNEFEYEGEYEGEFETGSRSHNPPTQRRTKKKKRQEKLLRQNDPKQARKNLANYAQKQQPRERLDVSRAAFGKKIVARSGKKGSVIKYKNNDPTKGEIVKEDIPTDKAWKNMVQKHGVVKRTKLGPENCAEAHLWQSLHKKGQRPKNVPIMVAKVDKRNRTHMDKPCLNCRQWVGQEFRSVNKLRQESPPRAIRKENRRRPK